MFLLKEKLMNALGATGTILYYLASMLVAFFPIFIISKSFWISLLFFWIIQIFPISSVVFWIWGLIITLKGPQDMIAIFYYVLFVIMFLPFFIGAVFDFFNAHVTR